MDVYFGISVCLALTIHLCSLVTSLPRGIQVQRRVVNGRTMERGEWPFLVSLHYLKPFAFTRHTHMNHVCGGALIHPQWVITAGHCVGFLEELGKVENWNVVLGEHNQYLRDRGEQTIKPDTFFVHPGFTPHTSNNLLNDMALIKLARPAVMTDNVGLIHMNNNTELREYSRCQIGGWGQVSSDPYGWGMYIPLKAKVYMIGNEVCNDIYSNLVYEEGDIHILVDDTILCAGIPVMQQSGLQKDGGGVSDACNGDSGSPLVCYTVPDEEPEIVGVVSAGKGCGSGKYPGIYSRMSSFNDWVQETMNNN